MEKTKAKDRINFLLEEIIFKQAEVDVSRVVKNRTHVTGDPAQDEGLLEQVEAALEKLNNSPEKKFIEAVVEAEKLGVKFLFTFEGGYGNLIRCGEKVVKVIRDFSYPPFSSAKELYSMLEKETKKLQDARRELTERLSAIEKRLDIYLGQ